MPEPSPSSHASTPPVLSISPTTMARDGSLAAPDEDSRQPRPARWLGALLAIVLTATILVALISGGLLATAHARDRYWVNIASGSWLALAWTANHGELYPPLRDEAGNFAGTRYMPLHVLAHAGLARATGEYLFSGKIIACVSAFGWMIGIFALARQRGSPRLFAGALAASVLLSPVGFQALCTIRSDGAALALQLGALWCAGRIGPQGGAKLAAIAGLCCALAFLAKLSAVWAAPAIGVWLLARNRTALAAFVASGAIITGGSLVALHVLSDGRMLDNMLHAGGSGWQGWGSVLLWSQRRLLAFISEWSPTTWVLTPAAALALLLAAARRDIQLIHLAWLTCCAMMAIMFADIGVGENHIIELAAITAAAAGDLWGRAGQSESHRPAQWSVAQMLLAVAVGWSSLAVLKQRLWPDLTQAVAILRSGETPAQFDPHAFDSLLAGKTFLSDDPSIAVLLDRKPVVSDAFLFKRFDASRAEYVAQLIDRINRREFDAVVLLREPDPASWWYGELFFGRPVIEAISANYRFDRLIGEHRVYVKKDA